MIEVQIRLDNAVELAAAFSKAPQLATEAYSRAIERTAYKIEGDAKRKAPVNKQSGGGNLRQSISSRMNGKLSAIIESKAKYSLYVDQGTRPHIISVVNKRVLANKRSGRIFGRVVHHPGTKAQPYFSGAVKDNEPFFNNEMQEALQNVLNEIK